MGQEGRAAPANFQLQPAEADSRPNPAPAGQQTKPTLEAIDRHVLESVDDHAIQVRGEFRLNENSILHIYFCFFSIITFIILYRS